MQGNILRRRTAQIMGLFSQRILKLLSKKSLEFVIRLNSIFFFQFKISIQRMAVYKTKYPENWVEIRISGTGGFAAQSGLLQSIKENLIYFVTRAIYTALLTSRH